VLIYFIRCVATLAAREADAATGDFTLKLDKLRAREGERRERCRDMIDSQTCVAKSIELLPLEKSAR
jgi:hypothetical protein